MKKLLILALILVGAFQLHQAGHLDALTSEFSSVERLEQQLQDKTMQLDFFRKAISHAQATAPLCGGKRRQVVISDQTVKEMRQLEEEIADLKKRIAQKKN
jgi:peptidoglycan hydrolase CwlO-like protein